MSFRITVTYVCDECGRESSHEHASEALGERIACLKTYPRDWQRMTALPPERDLCHTCKPKSMREDSR